MNVRSTTAFLALAGLTSLAAAQQGGFTLFGDPATALKGDDAFVHPVTSPYYNENSFITSDVRAWYLVHKFNSDTALGPDSNATVFAVQLRVALTSNLQLVAYKDGYIDFDGAVINSEGLNDVGAGLKWQWLALQDDKLYSAVGAGYEFAWGESRALQNDSEARLWASIDKGWGKLHTGATLNYRVSTSDENRDNGNSDVFSWHLRADYRLTEVFSPVLEFNGYHVINDSATGLALNGADPVNFGGLNADPTISAGIGCEFRAGESTAVRAAYELPLSDNKDSLFGTRLTFSLVYSF